MIEILEKENITGQDIQKVKQSDYLIIEDRLFISYEESPELFNKLLKELDRKRIIKILSGGDYNIIDIVKSSIDKEVREKNIEVIKSTIEVVRKTINKKGNG